MYKFYIYSNTIFIPIETRDDESAVIQINKTTFNDKFSYRIGKYSIHCSTLVSDHFLTQETEIDEDMKKALIHFIFEGLERQIELGNTNLDYVGLDE